jgi:hypothetical protein
MQKVIQRVLIKRALVTKGAMPEGSRRRYNMAEEQAVGGRSQDNLGESTNEL